jgi:hypothetical protein
MDFKTLPTNIKGLGSQEQKMLDDLVEIFNYHQAKNEKKIKYYEGDISLSDVNLGIAIPKNFNKLTIGCNWGAKTVDVLAARSMFDGYVSASGANAGNLQEIAENNNLMYEYMKACRDELKFGCTFATLSADPIIGCRIRFHSPMSAAAVWSGEKGRIAYGLAVIDTRKDESDQTWQPSIINLYTDDAIWVLKKGTYTWTATRNPHSIGRPWMVPMVWDATSKKPFGRSRIKKPIRGLIQSYVRTVANATIGLEFATAPQKYLLGVTDEQYDNIISNKFKQYAGNLLAATANPETGENPNFGQLAQGSITPHVEMLRMVATQFSAATGLSVTDTGVVNDANPTSSDAIEAQTKTLVTLAGELNRGNGEALKTIGQMAEAISQRKTLDDLTDDERNVIAHFKNPALPSVASTADAAIKIASTRQGFSDTDVFLEMVGFDQADIRRIKAQEQRSRGADLLKQEFAAQNFNQSNKEPDTENEDQEPQEPEDEQ